MTSIELEKEGLMRPRFALLAAALATSAALALAGTGAAAPVNRLSINTTPNPIIAGDGVLIYGHLSGPGAAHQLIILYRRPAPFGPTQVAGRTHTDSAGYYAFTHAENVVATNRVWFTVAPALGVRSRSVRERVAALISLAPSGASTDTSHPVVFTGHVFPYGFHVGERISLQALVGGTGDDWRTLKTGVIDAGSNFSISYRFRVPGDFDVRAVLHGDSRNAAGESDAVTVTVQQTENLAFTINTTAPVIVDGQSATLSGVLYAPPASSGSAPVPDPNVPVTLWARAIGASKSRPVDHSMTGADGSYSFTVAPAQDTVYRVATTFRPPPIQHTATVYEAVRDLVSMSASATTTAVGQPIRLSGTVTPDKAGHLIYLERFGKDGDFHTVAIAFVTAASAYQFEWRPGTQGSFTLRATVPGDRVNATGSSAPVTLTATLAPVPTLPPAS
jgi:hypothetical protein